MARYLTGRAARFIARVTLYPLTTIDSLYKVMYLLTQLTAPSSLYTVIVSAKFQLASQITM